MITIEIEEKKEGSFLKLPDIPDVSLPPVTIVTPTYNRLSEFPIAIRNWKNFNYPRHKLYWIILDDSDLPEGSSDKLKEYLETELPEDFKNNKIKYVHYTQLETQLETQNKPKKLEKLEKLKIGKKRNMLAEMCKTDIICHMDDDDYYYPDSIKIRVTALFFYKKPVCGCMQYNCYNLVDDTQFIARGNEENMNCGEASLCYLKSYWEEHKYCDTDTHEEAVAFLKGNSKYYVDIPCLWILLSISHGRNVSGRKSYQEVLQFSFLDLLPASDFEFIKKQKLNLMLSRPFNKSCMDKANLIKKSDNKEQLINKLSIKERKNVIIRDLLNNIPSKTTSTEIDFLILFFSAQYVRDLKFEKETELIDFIKDNKNKYRFTIYTDCDVGYNYQGITLSPYWKWRSRNEYHTALVMYDPSHMKLNINAKNIYFFNKYNFNLPEMQYAKEIKNFDEIDF